MWPRPPSYPSGLSSLLTFIRNNHRLFTFTQRINPALKRGVATLAAGQAEAYRSGARNEQPGRGSVISLMPATTAYTLPWLKLRTKKSLGCSVS